MNITQEEFNEFLGEMVKSAESHNISKEEITTITAERAVPDAA